jgi:hypothetical protein
MLKKRLKVLIGILLMSIIIVDIINLILFVSILGIFSPVCTIAACLALYGKFEKEDDPIWSDPPLVVIISIAIAVLLNFIILVGSLKSPMVVLLYVFSICLNIILAALLIYYYKKIILSNNRYEIKILK